MVASAGWKKVGSDGTDLLLAEVTWLGVSLSAGAAAGDVSSFTAVLDGTSVSLEGALLSDDVDVVIAAPTTEDTTVLDNSSPFFELLLTAATVFSEESSCIIAL